jgi:23S rRNA (cytosine1962-C5)-methyltransferase
VKDEKIIMFTNRLAKKFRHLRKQAAGISCYRVYDHDLPEFPFCIEIYGDKLYMAEYLRRHKLSEEAHEIWLAECMEQAAAILNIDPANVFGKLRRRKAGREGQYQKLDERKDIFKVQESGLTFIVNLSDYLDTGLFLDHRVTRKMVRDSSAGKKVLNLFAYTGSFSVYAAAGGASEVVTVDLSKTYLDWAEKNMAENGFTDTDKYKYIQADVLQFLPAEKPNYYDIIILDPPTFSNSKRMEGFLDIQRDHVKLINNCIRLLNPGGIIYFSTNARKFVPDIAHINAESFTDITRQTTPFDFEGKLERLCYRINGS